MTVSGPRYTNEVDPSHVGRRVTVRHVIRDGDRDRPTDVIGDLVDADDHAFTIRRRSGEVVVVDRARILASKLLPPRPAPRSPRRQN